jgi:hypothetical protein
MDGFLWWLSSYAVNHKSFNHCRLWRIPFPALLVTNLLIDTVSNQATQRNLNKKTK